MVFSIEDCAEKAPIVHLARTGAFRGNLELAIHQFNPDLSFRKPSPPPVQAYGIFHPAPESYLLNLSYDPETPFNPNTLLIISSHSNGQNRVVLEKFQQLTGIDFPLLAPIKASRHYSFYGAILRLLEKKPDETMELLRDTEKIRALARKELGEQR